MTAAQYIAACNKLGLSPGYSAAKAFGYSVRSVQRYRDGTWPVPKALAIALRLAERHPRSFREIMQTEI